LKSETKEDGFTIFSSITDNDEEISEVLEGVLVVVLMGVEDEEQPDE